MQAFLVDQDLDQLITAYFEAFFNQALSLNSKEHFLAYLKFFECSVSMVVSCPESNDALEKNIDFFLQKLAILTSQGDAWILKILNQLPLFILKKCCGLLSQYEQLKSSEKRQKFLNLFKIIHKNIDAKHAQHIKIAMNQL